MFRRKCKITFIRHGSTIYTEDNRLSDNENFPPLNEYGKIEAEKIAQWVQKRSPKVDYIYTSSDLKSIQTCKYIAKEYNRNFEIINNIPTRKVGKWKSLTFKDIEQKYPEELDAYHKNRALYKTENAENYTEFSNRIRQSIADLITKNTGKRIIIVTTEDVIQSEICCALNIPLENINRIYIPCGSATQLSYFEGWTSLVYSAQVPLL